MIDSVAGRRVPALAGTLAAALVLAGNGPPPVDAGFGVVDAAGEWRAVDPDGATVEPGWSRLPNGIEYVEMPIGASRGWRGRAIAVRFDPRLYTFRLSHETRAGGTLGAWSIDRLAEDAVAALNTGHFDGGLPWGWLVLDGIERRPPGTGPLSSAVVFARDGDVRIVPWALIPVARFSGTVAWAFQSYPTLLIGGEVPSQLRAEAGGVDLDHRDIRLAIGRTSDGRIIIVLTRFGDATGYSLPFGPTLPELAGMMRALGAHDAVALDGGLSAQLAVRGFGDIVREWASPRKVPVGLEVVVRAW